MKHLSISGYQNNNISFIQDNSCERKPPLSFKRVNKQSTIDIVEMWSKKMKQKCDRMIQEMKMKQEHSMRRIHNISNFTIINKDVNLMKRSDKTTLPRSRLGSFVLQEHNSPYMKDEQILSYYHNTNSRSPGKANSTSRLNKLNPLQEIKGCLAQCDTLIQDVKNISKTYNKPPIDKFKVYVNRRQKEKLKEMFLISKQCS